MSAMTRRMGVAFGVGIAAICHAPIAAADGEAPAEQTVPARDEPVRLGPVPVIPEGLPTLEPASLNAAVAETVGGPAPFVDVRDRETVTALYRDATREPTPDMAWTGSIPGCVAGEVSTAFHEATLKRINLYRALTGVPPVEELAEVGMSRAPDADPFDSPDPQEAALMMSAQGSLSHYPDEPWACWSPDGYDGASYSNLALGNAGPDAIDAYMFDSGANNISVGHRRWLLHPPLLAMASGDVSGSDDGWVANAVQVIGLRRAATFATRDDALMWPNPGYVPRTLVPERWSLSMDGADFESATVTALHNGEPSPVTVVSRSPEPAWNAIVWTYDDPAHAPHRRARIGDAVYTVTVDGIRVGGETRSLRYETVVYDAGEVDASPDALDTDEDNDGVFAGSALDASELQSRGYYWYVEPDFAAAQSFVAERSGTVDRVLMSFTCPEASSIATVGLSPLFDGVPGQPIASTTWSRPAVGSSFQVALNFSGGARLEAGAAYALTVETTGRCHWSATAEDYPGGTAMVGWNGAYSPRDRDYTFGIVLTPDAIDNCPDVANPDQLDNDSDGLGDACDPEIVLAPNRWHMLSLPALPPENERTVRAVFGDDMVGTYGSDWIVFGYDIHTGAYADPGLDGELQVGEGYWVTHSGDSDASVDLPSNSVAVAYEPSARCAFALRCHPIALTTGASSAWTLAGVGSVLPIDMATLRVSTEFGPCADIDACTVAEAQTSGAVSGQLFRWNGTTYAGMNTSGTLQPWHGYWVSLPPASEAQWRVSLR